MLNTLFNLLNYDKVLDISIKTLYIL